MIICIITFTISRAGLHHNIMRSIDAFTGFITSYKTSFLDYLTFQSAALIGNAVGGVVFVAILKYGAFLANNKGYEVAIATNFTSKQ